MWKFSLRVLELWWWIELLLRWHVRLLWHDLVVAVRALRTLSPLVVAHASLVFCILAMVWVFVALLQPSPPM